MKPAPRTDSLHRVGRSSRCARRAFSLVELLIVISIIGVLVGLLFPAVQSVRQAALRTYCQNNTRQIGIALHAYHDIHGALPIGCIEWRGFNAPPTFRQFAWSAQLLPFLEHSNLFERIDWDLPYDAASNRPAAEARVTVYECPSADRPTSLGRTDYGGLYGERILDSAPDDGVFLYDQAVSFRDIRDGLSNTLAVGEDVGGPDAEWINGRNVFVVAHGVNDPGAWIGDNEIRSRHPGGATVLFADGHTRFLSETIAPPTLGALVTRSRGEPIHNDSY